MSRQEKVTLVDESTLKNWLEEQMFIYELPAYKTYSTSNNQNDLYKKPIRTNKRSLQNRTSGN